MGTAMVWGAGGGIGRALVGALKEQGWAVAGVGRRGSSHRPGPTPALPLAGTPAAGGADYWFEADVGDGFGVQRAVMEAAQEVHEVDLWVYAVGDIVSQPVAEMDERTLARILDANLTGAFRAIHYSLPLLAERAHIVFVGAYSERLRLPGLAAYAAAKAGLEALAVTLAKEERRRRVTVVRPGAVATPLWEKMPMRLPRSASTAEEIAGKILAAHVAGQSGVIDL